MSRDSYREREIAPQDSVVRAGGPGEGEERVLRAKYLDWCSARVAERFLKLTPDEIYELAQGASHGAEPGAARRAPGPSSSESPESPADPAILDAADEPESFRRIVELVTEVLTRELDLPDFERWRAAYEAAPEVYDEDLLGLWREGL